MTPEQAYQEVQKGFQVYAEQQYDTAETIADAVLHELPNDPNGLYLKGICRRVHRDFDTSLDLINKACLIAPGVLSFKLAVGQVLSDLQKYQDAIDSFRQSMADFPNEVLPRVRLAELYFQLGAFQEAREAIDAGLFLQEDHPELHLLMAHIYNRQQDVNGVIYHADRALVGKPDWYDAILLRARADILKKDYYSAINRLNKVTPPSEFEICERSALLADAFHQLKDYDRAIAAWDDGNKTAREYFRQTYEHIDSPVNLTGVRRARDFFNSIANSAQYQTSHKTLDKSPVFLLGFPRSGSAMIDQLLAAHPDIDLSDQRNCFVPVVQEFGTSEATCQRFYDLTEDELEQLRAAYWERVAQSGVNTDERIHIERSPLSITWLGFIGRLFPDARIIISIRDPRDTVFAAYQTNFDMNAAMYHMLDLREAAEYFDAAYSSAYAAIDLCPGLRVLEVKYEDILLNFEEQVTRLFKFFDKEVDPESFNTSKSITHGGDDTPSVTLMNQLLYESSVNKWRHYEKVLLPVADVLEPWVKRFGYTP